MDRERVVREGYEAIAADYDEQRSLDGRGAEMVVDLAGDLPADARVLDAGCGGGRPVAELLGRDHRVVGLDIARAQLDLAAGRVPALRPTQGTLTDLPFADDAFDAVVSYYAVIHVPRERHADVFSEFRRVLRPGGEVLVVLGSEPFEDANDDWLGTGKTMAWSFYGRERNLELLREAGFRVDYEELVADELGGEFLHVRAGVEVE